MYRRRGQWALKNTGKTQKPTVAAISKKFGKKGAERKILPKGPSQYLPEGSFIPKVKKSKVYQTPRLRSSIQPGTVLIILAGKYSGRRVVFIKQLTSGLLLVSGPRKLNGVPLRRVNQSYVIATSTKVDISGVKVDEKINDAFFTKPAEKTKKTESEFFADKKQEKPKANPEKLALVKAVDTAVLAAVKKDKLLVGYLRSSFSLSNSQFPHKLKILNG